MSAITRENSGHRDLLSRCAAGLTAAVAQLAVGELAATVLPGARSPITGTGRALIDLTPGPLIDIGVGLVEDKDKPMLMSTVVSGALGSGVLAGYLSKRYPGMGTGVLAGSGAFAALAGASRRDSAMLPSIAANAVGAATGTLVLKRLSQRAAGPIPLALFLLAGSAAGLLAYHRAARRKRELLAAQRLVRLPEAARPVEAPSKETSFDIPGLSPLFTPVEDFYVTDVTLPPPVIDPMSWRLRVHGMVEKELELTLDDLLETELEELDATLVCVHNPVGGDRVGTARWRGIRVADLLERSGISPGADQVLARSTDGFTAGVPLELLTNGRQALIVIAMNGEPLTVEHGFPARLLVPGIYGYNANTKWLSELEITASDTVTDYWTKRGWPRTPAHVQTHSRIDVPRNHATVPPGPIKVAGVAWSPPDGVRGVEVAIDGDPWRIAELSREIAPTAWRQWQYDWRALPGEHLIRVRAIGSEGLQSEHEAPPYPNGSSGYHAIKVSVSPEGGQQPYMSRLLSETNRRLELATAGAWSWLRHSRLWSDR